MKTTCTILLIILILCVSCTEEQLIETSPINTDLTSADFTDSEYTLALNMTKNFLSKNSIMSKGRSQIVPELRVTNVNKIDYDVELTKDDLINFREGNLEDSVISQSIPVYTISFDIEGQQGYSIVAGDNRLPEVLVLTENGNISDTIYNKDLAYFMQNVENLVEYKLKQFYRDVKITNAETGGAARSSWYHPRKPSIPSGTTNVRSIDDDCMMIHEFTLTNGKLVADIGPLLKTRWSQQAPYNNYCKNGNAPAGCVPVATAQIMAYFKKPYTVYNN